MSLSTLTSKGQTTIPKEIRDYLGIKPRERLSFEITNNTVVVKRASRSMAELAASMKSSTKSADKSSERKSVAEYLSKKDQRKRA